MRVSQLVHHRDVIQLNVQVLVHALQGAAYGYIVLELNGDFGIDQRLEEAALTVSLGAIVLKRQIAYLKNSMLATDVLFVLSR